MHKIQKNDSKKFLLAEKLTTNTESSKYGEESGDDSEPPDNISHSTKIFNLNKCWEVWL